MKKAIVVVSENSDDTMKLCRILKEVVPIDKIDIRSYLSVRDALAAIYLIQSHKIEIVVIVSNKLSEEYEVMDLLKKANRECPNIVLIVVGPNPIKEKLDFEYIYIPKVELLKEIIYNLTKNIS